MSYSLYVVRDTASGHFINKAPAGQGAELFVSDLSNAFVWDSYKDASWLSRALTHDGRVCEVLEIHPSTGGQQ